MPRIYYKEEKIAGQSFSNRFINIESFDEIFECMDARLFEFDQPVQGGFFQKLFRQTKIIFKYAQLSRDGIPYNTTEGSFYLPTAIIFYDVDDANFPSEFYFIAKIGQQLELRQCDAGLGVKWFQIPDLHHAVTDSKVIQKIGD